MPKRGVILCLFLLITGGYVHSQADLYPPARLTEKDVNVTSFEWMDYPTLDRVEGIVVVRLQLDKQGTVAKAVALSGNKVLAKAALANVQKWSFQPNAAQEAIVVYNFRIAQGLCKKPTTLFALRTPNLANVTVCRPGSAAATGPSGPARAADARQDSGEPDLVNYEEGAVPYPVYARQAAIEGIVVVQAELNDVGQVVEAVALYGDRILLPQTLIDAKKWRFQPNPQHRAIIVYWFRYFGEDFPCSISWDFHGQFVLQPPNFVTVSTTRACPVP